MPEPIQNDTSYAAQLNGLSDPELKAVGLRLGITMGPRLGRATLLARIQQQSKALINDALKAFDAAPLPKEAPDYFQSEEQVRDACKVYLAKEGFEAVFNHDEDTFHFSYKKRIESGTLHQPMKNIVRTAGAVAMGPFYLRAADGFERDTSVSPNAYAQNVIQ